MTGTLKAVAIVLVLGMFNTCIPPEVFQTNVSYDPIEGLLYLDNSSEEAWITSVWIDPKRSVSCIFDLDSVKIKEFQLPRNVKDSCFIQPDDSLYIKIEVEFQEGEGSYQYRGKKAQGYLGVFILSPYII